MNDQAALRSNSFNRQADNPARARATLEVRNRLPDLGPGDFRGEQLSRSRQTPTLLYIKESLSVRLSVAGRFG